MNADRMLRAADSAVSTALAPVVDGVLEAWATSRNFGLNIKELSSELLFVQATLEQAAHKELAGPATVEVLQKLRDSAHDARNLLEELDYFRRHHELQEAADEHAKHGGRDQVPKARHTTKAVAKLLNCCARQRSCGDSSLTPNANQDVSECMAKLGKIFHCSCSPYPRARDDDSGNAQETPGLQLDRVGFSQRMKDTIEQLNLTRKSVAEILQLCAPRTILDIAQRRPRTTSQSTEPKLYGRDHVMYNIIHDITKGQYCDKGLTVLPVVGPGGMGKTTLIQHIYNNQQVQNHFLVRIWICVSFSFNLDKVLEQIKRDTLPVEGENGCITTQELIEHRLKYKRFLLVLDDIWQFTDVDDWKKLLLILGKSQEKGSMILVTTRQKEIAYQVKKTKEPIELNGLELGEFRKLFLVYVFDAEQYPEDKLDLVDIGDEIMEKLRCSPLAAKTVGRLLRTDPSLPHWKRVLNSKEWEKQTADNDFMPTLKLSYDFLPFHLQQCISSSALFPEDYCFRSNELINLWIGLDILPDGQMKTFEDIGLMNLNELVINGFFREEETDGDVWYVMHGLLHDLALEVASHDYLSLHLSNVGSVEIQPSTRHLSVITEGLSEYDAVSGAELKRVLEKMKTSLKVEHLQTLMLFGVMDGSFAKIFGDFFGEANALRVLYLPDMMYPVESMLHNFSRLVHLRYLFLGTKDRGLIHRFLCPGTEYESKMHLPLAISKFYDLRILDLGSWYGRCDFPKDMSNLTKLRHFVTPKDELHSAICNVGKLKLLEELKVFRVDKESEGFEPKQLEHLTELTELGIYNLENIRTEEEAAQAKLIEKNYLQKLTLDWDSKRSNTEPHVEAVVLESLQPHGDLQVLCIRGHGGSSCPTWLGDEFAVEALQSLCLDGVSWEVFPSLGNAWDLCELRLQRIARLKDITIEKSYCMLNKLELIGLASFEKWVFPAEQESSLAGDLLPPDAHMFPLLQVLIIRDCPKLLRLPFPNHIVCPPDQDWNVDCFPKLQELEIDKCPELLLLPPIPWTETLCSVSIRGVMLLQKLLYSNSSHGVRLDIVGKDDLHSLDQVLVFNKLTKLEELSLVKCPPLGLKHLLYLTSLKTLIAESSDTLVEPLGGQGDVEWLLPVGHIEVQELSGNSGKELTELLTHLPRLSKLGITECGNITHLVVGVDLQQTASTASELDKDEMPPPAAATAAEREKEDGVLLFPAHASDTLRELVISHCPELVLVAPPTLLPDGGGLQALRCLQRLKLKETPKFLSAYLFSSPSCCLFPSSLQFLELNGVEGMGTVEPLSNLTSLTLLELRNCGEDLRCEGLGPLLTTGGQLGALIVYGSPRFFAGWDPNPGWVLQDERGEQQLQPSSSKLQKLWTDDTAGLLAMPICNLLTSSLTQLQLSGTKEMECFSNEQEAALQLLTCLRELEFFGFDKLQRLPAGLHNLTCLVELQVGSCPSVGSLSMDGLPKSLQKLDVWDCGNEELIHQCKGSMGIYPKVRLEF